MANLSQIQVGGTTYDICDTTARDSISQINKFLSDIYMPDGVEQTGILRIAGYMTSANQSLIFTIPLLFGIIDISRNPSITINTASSLAWVRQNGSYLIGTANGRATLSSVITSYTIDHIRRFYFDATFFKSSGWGGTNNDTVVLDVDLHYTVHYQD